jgi:hypothetical protein
MEAQGRRNHRRNGSNRGNSNWFEIGHFGPTPLVGPTPRYQTAPPAAEFHIGTFDPEQDITEEDMYSQWDEAENKRAKEEEEHLKKMNDPEDWPELSPASKTTAPAKERKQQQPDPDPEQDNGIQPGNDGWPSISPDKRRERQPAVRGAIHQCLRIILNSDSKRDS